MRKRFLCAIGIHRPLLGHVHTLSEPPHVEWFFYSMCPCGKIWFTRTASKWIGVKISSTSMQYWISKVWAKPDFTSCRSLHPLHGIQDGVKGDWEIRSEVITQKTFKKYAPKAILLKNIKNPFFPAQIYGKRIRRLMYKGDVVMSNLPHEFLSLEPFYRVIRQRKKFQRVLILGLGLAHAYHIIKPLKRVRRIDIVEKSTDLLDLVAPSIDDKRVNFINESVFSFRPEHRYDACVIDIWPHKVNWSQREREEALSDLTGLSSNLEGKVDYIETWAPRYFCEAVLTELVYGVGYGR